MHVIDFASLAHPAATCRAFVLQFVENFEPKSRTARTVFRYLSSPPAFGCQHGVPPEHVCPYLLDGHPFNQQLVEEGLMTSNVAVICLVGALGHLEDCLLKEVVALLRGEFSPRSSQRFDDELDPISTFELLRTDAADPMEGAAPEAQGGLCARQAIAPSGISSAACTHPRWSVLARTSAPAAKGGGSNHVALQPHQSPLESCSHSMPWRHSHFPLLPSTYSWNALFTLSLLVTGWALLPMRNP